MPTDEERDRFWNEVHDPPMHWDRLGVPISLREWSELLEDDEYRSIGSTMIAGRWWVSTVWLGIDPLGTLFGGPPIIFETMVFDTAAPGAYEQERYVTESEARLGHERMVQLVMTLEGTVDRIDV
jgi:hypothetical protein